MDTEFDRVAAALSRNLAFYRAERGLTQDGLARKSGISAGTVSKIERRRANPPLTYVCALAAALDVSTEQLLCPVPRQGH